MNQEKILVVDDEVVIFEALNNYLQTDYQLIHAKHGEEGLKLFAEHNPDVIILDIRMPVMDGFEFLEKMGVTPDVPYSVIVLTGHVRGKEVMQCFDMGISAFLRKPFNLYEVKGLVRQCIQTKRLYKEIQEKEKSIRSLIEGSLDMILSVDRDFNITEFNPAAQKKFAYTPAEVIGQHWRILFPDTEQEALARPFGISGGKLSREIQLQRKSGEMFPALFSAAAIHGEGGRVSGAVCNARDLTAEKELAKIMRAERDLEVSKMTLTTVNDTIRNALNALLLLRVQAERAQGVDGRVIEAFDEGMQRITDFLSKIGAIKRFAEKDVRAGAMLDIDASQ